MAEAAREMAAKDANEKLTHRRLTVLELAGTGQRHQRRAGTAELTGPTRSAAGAMMSSAALPKVALRNRPTPMPVHSASCSVAWPIHAANGRMRGPT
jgi:hypothetical protein